MVVQRLLKDGDILFCEGKRVIVCSIIHQELKEGILKALVVSQDVEEIDFDSSKEGSNILYTRNIDSERVISDFSEMEELINSSYDLFAIEKDGRGFFGDIFTFRLKEGSSLEVSLENEIFPPRGSFGLKKTKVFDINDEKEELKKITPWVTSQLVVGNLERVEIHVGSGVDGDELVSRDSFIISGTDDDMEFKKYLQVGTRKISGRSDLRYRINPNDYVSPVALMYYMAILKNMLSSLDYCEGCEGLREGFLSPGYEGSYFKLESNFDTKETYNLHIRSKIGREKDFSISVKFDDDFYVTKDFVISEGFNVAKDDLQYCLERALRWFDLLPFSVRSIVINLSKDYSRQRVLKNSRVVRSMKEEGSVEILVSDRV